MTARRQSRRASRGAALVAFAVTLTAFLALTVVAVDVGRLADAANEVQAVADVAATAGALTLVRGGTAGGARADASSAVQQNVVAGAAAAIAAADVLVGQYDAITNTFTPTDVNASAVKATPHATVQNLFAGYFGANSLQTTITKTAIAGFAGLGEACGTGEPCIDLPIAIGQCKFPSLQSCFSNSCMPQITLTTNNNNGAWTSFHDTPPNKNTIEPFLPSCGKGTSKRPGTITVGGSSASINLLNGNSMPLFGDLKGCFDRGAWQYGTTKFLLPIVNACGQFNQSASVVGFATVTISAVTAGNNASVTLAAILNDVQGPPGGGAFGTGSMRMFN